jgi:hypothetical protein
LIVRQSTAPQLLYASIIQLAPDHSRLVPGIEPYINPLRDQVRKDFTGDPLQLVKVSKQIRDDIDPYLWTQIRDKRMYYPVLNRTLRNLCLDAILAHPASAMRIPLEKFRLAVDSSSAYQFSEAALQKAQFEAYTADKDKSLYETLTKGLTGTQLDQPGIQSFIATHYQADRVAWLGKLQAAWNNTFIAWRTPDHPLNHPRWVHDFAGGVPGGLRVMPGFPWYYAIALLGMLAAILRPAWTRRVHIAWAPVMLLVWYAATLVGVTNARYRFAYEPYLFVYVCLLVDSLICLTTQLRNSGQSAKPY